MKRSTKDGEAGHGVIAEGLHKRFGERLVVNDLSFRIARGEIYGLLGPNGAGKSTTIGLLANALVPDSGTITVSGQSTRSNPSFVASQIGLVPQEVSLYPVLSAEDNLRFFGRLYLVERPLLQDRVEEMLELAVLGDRRHEPVHNFSGGMQRRLNLVCGLIHRPSVLLLDEPTAGVDPQSRERLFEMIEQQGADGLSVLYTTHYMEEAERLCHRIGIMDGGRLVAEGTHSELVTRLKNVRSVRLTLASVANEVLCRSLAAAGANSMGECGFVLEGDDLERRMRDLLEDVSREGNRVQSMSWGSPTLEDLFLQLTGKQLRD